MKDGFVQVAAGTLHPVVADPRHNTAEIVQRIREADAAGVQLLVLPEKNEKVVCSARNIPGVKTALVNTLNVYDVLNADKFIVVKDAVAQMEEVYK